MTQDVASVVLNPKRLEALQQTGLLASAPDESFERFTRLTSKLLDVPVALVSLVGPDHQFFKSCVGLPEPWASRRRTPLSHSFCKHVVATAEMLAIEDARIDPVLKHNLAVPEIGVVAYLGAPLKMEDGQVLGSLCAIDTRPRKWTEQDRQNLTDLAVFVTAEMNARRRTAAELKLQKEASEALLEDRVRFLADAMPQIVWTANAAGDITSYNRRWFDYTGMTFEQTKDGDGARWCIPTICRSAPSVGLRP